MKKLLTTKTFWAGAAAVVTTAGAYAMGEMTLAQAVQTLATGVIGVCIRHGMITTAGSAK